MNTKNYTPTANDIIDVLSKNIRRVIKMAYGNYEIGSKYFNELINSTSEPLRLVNELREAQEIANDRLRNNVIEKLKGDLEKETLNRLCVFNNRKKQSNTGVN